MGYVDFATLKERLPIADAIPLLGLEMKERGGQWRGPCPACGTGGPRALAITPEKGAFYCFAAKTGGDVIALAAHVRDCTAKEAARFLAGEETASPSPATVPNENRKGKEETPILKPLTYLEPGHPKALALGITEDVCRAYGAGYAPKGILRGRLAIPIHDLQGALVAYCGRAVGGEEPSLVFPKDFEAERHLFNADRIGEGELSVLRDPLDALRAIEAGLENTVSLLTETLSADQLRLIADLMDDRGLETVDIH